MNQQPPEEVPENLSAHEYQRLVALYTLMGRHNHAAKAFSKLSQTDAARLPEAGEAGTEQVATDKAVGGDGANFAQALMKLLQQLTREEVEKNSDGQGMHQRPGAGAGADDMKSGAINSRDMTSDDLKADDPLKAMLQQLLSIGLSEAEAQEYVQKLKRALADMTHPEPPPRELPEDLSAEEYWQLAVRYKQVGWTEQARDALTAAIEIDGEGEVGIKARCFLRSKIPRHPVPLMAEQLNIQGYNQMFVNELEAQKIFEQLVDEYADFEWPYGNLGSLLIKRGRLEEAEDLLMRAVEINPYYINGWLHLSRVHAIKGDFEQAEECLERVIAIDASDPNWKGIRDLINQLRDGFGE